ncbi:MAG: flagellar filament capping protein FliD [Desulfurivibrionaceae bacterium]|nr:flagellar filament capping protein FliD [Desulfurivibrionaceae bacterium]
MSFGVSGLMSGMDTDSLIKQMMAVERRPILQLQRQEAGIQARISGLGSVKAALAGLQGSVKDLKSLSTTKTFTAESANFDALAAKASASAVPGTYQVEVTALAQSQQVRSAVFTGSDAVVGTGDLTIQVGAANAVTLTIDSTNNTLAGIATAINEARAGVTAGVINAGDGKYYLTLAAGQSGAANTITLTMADADANNTDNAGLSSLYEVPADQTFFETQPAADAELILNGITVTRSGNTISDLVGGVTLTLKQADPGIPFALTVSRAATTAAGKLGGFVSQYNALVDTLNGLQTPDPKTGQGGLLQGDSLTRQVESRLRSFIHQSLGNAGDPVRSLSDLGVKVERNGQLSLDQTVLNAALEKDGDGVVNFLAGVSGGSQGFAGPVDTMLDQYLKGNTGLLATKEAGLKSSITRIGDQVERIELRLSMREENIRRQFNVLESLMADFQATSGTLDQQLQSLNNLSAQIAGNTK